MNRLAAADFKNSLPLRHHLGAITQQRNIKQMHERGQMSDQDYILANVQKAFKAAFDIDPQLVSMETTASDISGWDSVGHLSLASNLEEIFGISLDVDDLMEMENVREIVRVITT